MAKLLRAAPVVEELTGRIVVRVQELADVGTSVCLAIVRVGESDAELSYERSVLAKARTIGIKVKRFVLPKECGQNELMDAIAQINADPAIHGCLMLRPLPDGLSERQACEALDPQKDVDGITMRSLAGVFTGRSEGFSPCTAEAVMYLLHYYGYKLSGADVTVVGRSLVAGRPVAMMLQAADATVTVCHSKTPHLSEHLRSADFLVVATGHAGLVGASSVRPDQVVVDVGTNWDEVKARLVGDVAYDEVEPVVAALTPVPGGIGAVTTAILIKHVVESACRASGDGKAI